MKLFHWLTASIFFTKNASNSIWKLRSHNRNALSIAAILSAEKNWQPKTWKVCSLKKITKVSRTTLCSRLYPNRETSPGVPLRTATMPLCLIKLGTAKISSASNARKNIAWIAKLRRTRSSRAKSFREIGIQICWTKPLSSLWRALNSSSVPSAPCGSKKLKAATTWSAGAAPISATYAEATTQDVHASTEGRLGE